MSRQHGLRQPPLRDRLVQLVHGRVQNGDETDVDCGGTMCGKCGDGKRCTGATDCVSTRCRVQHVRLVQRRAS